MNIIFFGTPDLCIPYLETLLETEHKLLAIVCNPDRPIGRKQILTAPATKLWAAEHGIDVLQPEKVRDIIDVLTNYNPDLFIVIAYGGILPTKVIDLPTFGTINVHYSLLPRWRGATPVEAALLAGDSETAVTVQSMRFLLDSGPVLSHTTIQLDGSEYAVELKQTMTSIGAQLLAQTLPQIFDRSITAAEQNQSDITICKKIEKSQGELHETDSDLTKWRKYRAYKPWPGVFYFDNSGTRVKITDADYVGNKFIILSIIRDGEREMRVG